jgi:hypothetical protein
MVSLPDFIFWIKGHGLMANERVVATRTCIRVWWAALAIVILSAAHPREAQALIMGGEGNDPLHDPGWPQGAAPVFNTRARVAWWEGPPFGGGQWHAECRGDTQAFNEALADFARIDAKQKRIVVHDGIGHSFWLNPNRARDKDVDARIDWIFMVWQPDRWQFQQQLPAHIRPREKGAADAPVPQIDVYAGGNIKWADVKVPGGIEVVDNRLEAHGFKTTDGTVLEGNLYDLAGAAPLAGRMELQKVEPQETGGYQYTTVATAVADADGRWVLKSAPAGWYRVVLAAEGYVARVAGYNQFDEQPRWHSYAAGLSRAALVTGVVTDDEGAPLADADVRLDGVVAGADGSYETPQGYTMKTDRNGRFASTEVPVGSATVWVHKAGYCRPGLGLAIQTPASGVELTMFKAANLRVVIDFEATKRPDGYVVHIEHEGGAAPGRWGGSGNIDASGAIAFKDVPPGRYVLRGRPNPGSDDQETEPTTVELRGGDTKELILKAK